MVKRSLLMKILCEPIRFTDKFRNSNGLWTRWHRCWWLEFSLLEQFLLNYFLFLQETFQSRLLIGQIGMIFLRGVNIIIRSWDESSILISFRNVNKAIWENEFYYLFGFLFLVFIILIVACSQISIVMTYFQVYTEKK